MSDQSMPGGISDWYVDWAAAGTWWRFIGICVLIALVLFLGNIGSLGIARLVVSFAIDSGMGTAPGNRGSGDELPLLYSFASMFMVWVALGWSIIKWAQNLSCPSVPVDYPMDAAEEKKRTNIGWAILLLGLYTWLLFVADGMPLGPFSVTEENWEHYAIWCFLLLFCKDGVRVLLWWVLADRRVPHTRYFRVPSWIASNPGEVIAILAAICVITLLLTTVWFRA